MTVMPRCLLDEAHFAGSSKKFAEPELADLLKAPGYANGPMVNSLFELVSRCIYTCRHFHVSLHIILAVYFLNPSREGGDASTRHLAALQDEEMAALKGSSTFPELPSGQAARGRDNYSLYGVLRTKPGRADSPPTRSMSCSDKIASWNLLGIQGALASRFLLPVYIDTIVIGEVDPGVRDEIREDCKRAFWQRLESIDGLWIPFRRLERGD